MQDYMTVSELAKVFECDVKTMYRQLKQTDGRMNGIAVAVRIAGTWRVLPEAVERVKRGEYDESKAA